MSDIEPDLPAYLTDAIHSQAPTTEAVDLVKAAFTWRTVDRELLALTFDSLEEPAGVRDASDLRTMEFSMGEITVIVEFAGGAASGRVFPAHAGTARLRYLDAEIESEIDTEGSFRFETTKKGPARVSVTLDAEEVSSATFTIH